MICTIGGKYGLVPTISVPDIVALEGGRFVADKLSPRKLRLRRTLFAQGRSGNQVPVLISKKPKPRRGSENFAEPTPRGTAFQNQDERLTKGNFVLS